MPSTEQIPSGLENIESESDAVSLTSSTETISVSSSLNTSVEEDDEPVSKDGKKFQDSTHKERREMLGAQLAYYKEEKLKQKLPVDAQMFSYVKEDLQL